MYPRTSPELLRPPCAIAALNPLGSGLAAPPGLIGRGAAEPPALLLSLRRCFQIHVLLATSVARSPAVKAVGGLQQRLHGFAAGRLAAPSLVGFRASAGSLNRWARGLRAGPRARPSATGAVHFAATLVELRALRPGTSPLGRPGGLRAGSPGALRGVVFNLTGAVSGHGEITALGLVTSQRVGSAARPPASTRK